MEKFSYFYFLAVTFNDSYLFIIFLDASKFIEQDKIDCLRFVLKHQPEIVNMKDEETFYTLSHFSARKGKQEALSLLLEANSEHINDRNNHENTPLITAAANGKRACVELLINYHADINIKGYNGNTALMFATKNKHLNCVRLLLQHNADKCLKNNFGITAYDFAKNKELKTLLEEHL